MVTSEAIDQTTEQAAKPTFVLVPGAWMGGVSWQDAVTRLEKAGYRALTLTLTGLGEAADAELGEIGLERHVLDVVELLEQHDLSDVILVGHSYSGLIVGQVAERVPERIRHSVYVASFLPRDGRSLIDDWGDDEDMRVQERQDILDNGRVWEPPPAEGLPEIGDLSESDARWLSENFTPHPGGTVLDEVRLQTPITDQALTFVATGPEGEDPMASLPPELSASTPERWTLRTLTSGHWPMVSKPEQLVELLISEAG